MEIRDFVSMNKYRIALKKLTYRFGRERVSNLRALSKDRKYRNTLLSLNADPLKAIGVRDEKDRLSDYIDNRLLTIYGMYAHSTSTRSGSIYNICACHKCRIGR